jgi:hypothetical protein
MSSRNMCLLPRATLHSDSEQFPHFPEHPFHYLYKKPSVLVTLLLYKNMLLRCLYLTIQHKTNVSQNSTSPKRYITKQYLHRTVQQQRHKQYQ